MAWLFKRNGIYYAGWYESGREKGKSLRTRSVQRARAELVKMEENIERGRPIEYRCNMPIVEFTERFAVAFAGARRPHTVKGTLHTWGKFVAFGKPWVLADVTTLMVSEFKAHLVSSGLAPSTVRTALLRLSGVFSFAADEMKVFLGENPVKSVELPKAIERDPFYLNREEVKLLLDTAGKYERWKDVRLFISLAYYLGLRRNEAINVRWEWMDFERETVRIQNDGGFRTKNGKARTVSMSLRLVAILEPFRRSSGFICYPHLPEKTNPLRLRVDPGDAFSRVVAAAGLPDRTTPHVLRHSFGSVLAMSGVSLYEIMKLLGHSDARTTQMYAHLQERSEAVNNL